MRAMNADESFVGGHKYGASAGAKELSAGEIETRFPSAIADSFAQGMLDGLAGDSFRLRLVLAPPGKGRDRVYGRLPHVVEQRWRRFLREREEHTHLRQKLFATWAQDPDRTHADLVWGKMLRERGIVLDPKHERKENEMSTITIKTDYENNAPTWWEEFLSTPSAEVPEPLRPLLQDNTDEVTVAAEAEGDLRDWCASLPGWSDGPACAPNPLVFCD